MPGVKGMKVTPPKNSPFVKGHSIQPTAEQRAGGVLRAQRRKLAEAMRQAQTGIDPESPIAWLHEAVDIAREQRDAKALLNAVELTWLYTIGKPREQLSEREGIDMIAYIEEAARQMSERTIEGKIVEDEEQNTYPQE